MNEYEHDFADSLPEFVKGKTYTRAQVSALGYCTFLDNRKFCCDKGKSERGNLCNKHFLQVSQRTKEKKKEPKSAIKASGAKKSTAKTAPLRGLGERRFCHARWDELGEGVSISAQQALTTTEVFKLGFCTFVDQERFCCAQKLAGEDSQQTLCRDHFQRVQRERQNRLEQRKQKKERDEKQRLDAEKARLIKFAMSLQLASDCVDTFDVRMRLARRILALEDK